MEMEEVGKGKRDKNLGEEVRNRPKPDFSSRRVRECEFWVEFQERKCFANCQPDFTFDRSMPFSFKKRESQTEQEPSVSPRRGV